MFSDNSDRSLLSWEGSDWKAQGDEDWAYEIVHLTNLQMQHQDVFISLAREGHCRLSDWWEPKWKTRGVELKSEEREGRSHCHRSVLVKALWWLCRLGWHTSDASMVPIQYQFCRLLEMKAGNRRWEKPCSVEKALAQGYMLLYSSSCCELRTSL